jgi:hypothetical protein
MRPPALLRLLLLCAAARRAWSGVGPRVSPSVVASSAPSPRQALEPFVLSVTAVNGDTGVNGTMPLVYTNSCVSGGVRMLGAQCPLSHAVTPRPLQERL